MVFCGARMNNVETINATQFSKNENTASDTTYSKNAYRIWISEIMLQQTQVSVVIPYWLRWMKTWPTLLHLSDASDDELREHWAGLGYYNRAQRILDAAKAIRKNFFELIRNDDPDVDEAFFISQQRSRFGDFWDIPFPSTSPKDLIKYPGVGLYTAGAILSIAANQIVPAVDVNAVRVLSRILGYKSYINSSKLLKKIQETATEYISHEAPGDYNQAIMDLGAAICVPNNPHCSICPVRQHCRMYHELQAQSSKIQNQTLEVNDNPRHLHDKSISPCQICIQSQDVVYPLTNSRLKERPNLKYVAEVLWKFRSNFTEIDVLIFKKNNSKGVLRNEWGARLNSFEEIEKKNHEDQIHYNHCNNENQKASYVTNRICKKLQIKKSRQSLLLNSDLLDCNKRTRSSAFSPEHESIKLEGAEQKKIEADVKFEAKNELNVDRILTYLNHNFVDNELLKGSKIHHAAEYVGVVQHTFSHQTHEVYIVAVPLNNTRFDLSPSESWITIDIATTLPIKEWKPEWRITSSYMRKIMSSFIEYIKENKKIIMQKLSKMDDLK